MFRITHCTIKGFKRGVTGNLPITNRSIFIDCIRAIDDQSHRFQVRNISPLTNDNYEFFTLPFTLERLQIYRSIFLHCESAVQAADKWPIGIEKNAFVFCDYAVNLRDSRRDGSPGYPVPVPNDTGHLVRDSLFFGAAEDIQTTFLFATLEYCILSGDPGQFTIESDGLLPEGNIPVFHIEESEDPDAEFNFRLIWAGTDPRGIGELALWDTAGVRDAADGSDIGPYNRGTRAEILDRHTFEFESPPGSQWVIRSLQPARYEGQKAIKTASLHQYAVFTLDYSAPEYRHLGNRIIDVLRLLRASETSSEIFIVFDPQPPKSESSALLSKYPTWWADRFGVDYSADLLISNLRAPNTSLDYQAATGDLSGSAVLPAIESLPGKIERFPGHWFDGHFALIVPEDAWQLYNTGADPTLSSLPSIWMVVGQQNYAGEKPDTNDGTESILLEAINVTPADSGALRFVRSIGLYYFQLDWGSWGKDGSGWVATPVNVEPGKLFPKKLDDWILVLPNTSDLQFAFKVLELTDDVNAVPGQLIQHTAWDAEYNDSPSRFYLRGEVDGSYRARPIGLNNLFDFDESDSQFAKKVELIKASTFLGLVPSFYTAPNLDADLNQQNANAPNDTHFTNGAEWVATGRSETAIDGNTGFSQEVPMSAPTREESPADRLPPVNDFELPELYIVSGRKDGSYAHQLHEGVNGGVAQAILFRPIDQPTSPQEVNYTLKSTNPAVTDNFLLGIGHTLNDIKTAINALPGKRWFSEILTSFEGGGDALLVWVSPNLANGQIGPPVTDTFQLDVLWLQAQQFGGQTDYRPTLWAAINPGVELRFGPAYREPNIPEVLWLERWNLSPTVLRYWWKQFDRTWIEGV